MSVNSSNESDNKKAELSLGFFRWFVLLQSLIIMVLITIAPRIFGGSLEHYHHSAAMLLMMSMSAGFVYGIGFKPRFWLWRYLFSWLSVYIFLAVGIFLLM